MNKRIGLVSAAAIWFVLSAGLASGSTDEFAGKIVRMIVGFGAGGGFDTYSRIIARHLRRHIPGNPTIVVENMTGAGSLIAANHLYKVARLNSLTIGNVHGGLFLAQTLGRPGIEFESTKFEHLGIPSKDHPVCLVTKASGIASVDQWMASKAPLKLGGTAPGDSTYDTPKILRASLGLPIQVIGGYKGTAQIRLAVEGREVDGGCWGWASIKATWGKAIEAGEAIVILQATPESHRDLPKVPLAIHQSKTEEARQLIHAGIHAVSILTRAYVLPPGMPKDRVKMLRKAFMDTFNDREFLAEAKKTNLDIGPLSGDEIAKTVENLFKLEAPVIERL
ncbi:MAG: hypothetical protein HY695_26810, partial [Deltaproteobacteria bacterium]|nr:hypothetical protein [Deltaproteobacteria bacterium]